MTFIIVCSGTAGHINPGLSIAQELRERAAESKIIFIGSDRELEKRLIPEAGFELINIKMSGIRRSLKPRDLLYNIKTVFNVLSATRAASKIIKNAKPHAVIGTGGYICYPVLKAAAKQNIPTYVHESNACPGMAVKMLSAIATKVMITYPRFDAHYKHPERLVITGTPLRSGFYATENSENAHHGEKPLVVSYWGSLGAERMNEVMAVFIRKNVSEKRFHHIHATGSGGKNFRERLGGQGAEEIKPPYAQIHDYIDNMPCVMKAADLVLCRAGGITLAELTALGKPAILIPSPYVPDNAQYENASLLVEKGAALLIDERGCNAETLFKTVSELLEDKSKLQKMSQASRKLAKPNAAKDIVDIIIRGA